MHDVIQLRTIDLSPALFGRLGTWPQLPSVGGEAHLTGIAPAMARMAGRNAGGRWLGYLCRLSHGIVAGVSGLDVDMPVHLSSEGTGMLSVHVIVSGQMTLDSNQATAKQSHLHAGQAEMGMRDFRHIYTARLKPGSHLRLVRIVCEPDRLADDFDIAGGGERLREIFSANKVINLDTRALRVAQELIDLDFERPLALAQFEAKTLDLLIMLLEPLLQQAAPAPPGPPLSCQTHRQLHDVRALLALNFDAPPTIAALASKVGVNQSKLMRGFKGLFGETIAEYALRLRMERARHLLLHEELGVAQVGYRVGYQHHSSFTAAFTEYFGLTPSAVMEQARAEAR